MSGHIGDLLRSAIANPVMNSSERDNFTQQALRAEQDAKYYQIPAQLITWSIDPHSNHQQVLTVYTPQGAGLMCIFMMSNNSAS
ncbi:hypothetical protein P4S72_18355 [Vibrio sp. PP-XX7]